MLQSTTGARHTLRAESLDVWRGEACLFAGLSFELLPGQMALITGANGSGKTTLLRVLAGRTLPAGGSVSWSGAAVHRLAPETRSEISYQGHLDGLKKELTVRENLEFFREFWRGQEPIDPLLEELRLSSCRDREVRYLSAGQRRRTALGCMWLKPARLWLLDEPLTNLDAKGGELVAAWLQRHTSTGGLAVVATHQPEQLGASASIEIEL